MIYIEEGQSGATMQFENIEDILILVSFHANGMVPNPNNPAATITAP